MTDEASYPGVYLEETQPAKAIDGVATTGGGEQLEEAPPGRSIPGVPTSPYPQPSESGPVETAVAGERSGAPVRASEETDG